MNKDGERIKLDVDLERGFEQVKSSSGLRFEAPVKYYKVDDSGKRIGEKVTKAGNMAVEISIVSKTVLRDETELTVPQIKLTTVAPESLDILEDVIDLESKYFFDRTSSGRLLSGLVSGFNLFTERSVSSSFLMLDTQNSAFKAFLNCE